MRTKTLIVLAAVLVGTACQAETEAANRVTLGESEPQQGGLPVQIQDHIDAGNAAYRAKDYEAALRHYQDATEVDASQPTSWFGVAMAASALGDEALAESARQHVQQLDPSLAGASHGAAPEQPHPVKPHP